jgi:predicted nucleic acid-binding protein
MIVVADSSPLNYLIQINCDSVLGHLYDLVLVPSGVFEELRHPGAPPSVVSWVSNAPDWIRVHIVKARRDESLDMLDPGEREAIQLAEEQRADLLLIDERRGRLEAKRRGLAVTGTLGVLLSAGRRGLIDAEPAFHALVETTTFRASQGVRENFLVLCRQLRR